MRGYIFTPHEIQMIEQFHQDGWKSQAVRLLKHRCEERKAKLEEHLKILNDFLNDYANQIIVCSCGREFETKAGLLSHLRTNRSHYNATIGESISEMYARLAREAQR